LFIVRQGLNPAKKSGAMAYKPCNLGVFTILHIPFHSGYYTDLLEIFKIHVASLRQYTTPPFNYLVFDNGSTPEVKNELVQMHKEGIIDWLFLSKKNLGKTGAMNMVLAGISNPWVCYSDSDMLFRPGWLEASMEVYQNFPGCGTISAQVVFPDIEEDKGNSNFRQASGGEYAFTTIKPEEWILKEYFQGRGIAPENQAVFSSMLLDQVTSLTSGVSALLGGNTHQQWLAARKVIQQVLPLPAKFQLARAQTSVLDQRIDRLNYLRLSTTKPYMYHMGNTLDETILPEIDHLESLPNLKPEISSSQKTGKRPWLWNFLGWLNRRPGGNRLLLRIYNALYRLLSE
jgi:glycosyltransferase involved in cell wall biosynthesis